jgi:hypothetical protein
LLGSAGSLPAVFGSLPNTIFVGKLPTNAGLRSPESTHLLFDSECRSGLAIQLIM